MHYCTIDKLGSASSMILNGFLDEFNTFVYDDRVSEENRLLHYLSLGITSKKHQVLFLLGKECYTAFTAATLSASLRLNLSSYVYCTNSDQQFANRDN